MGISRGLATARAKVCLDCKISCNVGATGLHCGPPRRLIRAGRGRGTGEKLMGAGQSGAIWKRDKGYCPLGRWDGLQPKNLDKMADRQRAEQKEHARRRHKAIVKRAVVNMATMSMDAARDTLLDLVDEGLEGWLAYEIGREVGLE